MKQKQHRYEMHKYWGKKPSSDLSDLINKFSKEKDILLDPFSGYGVFACEALINKRNIISHDLNPVATFLQGQLFEADIDIFELKEVGKKIIRSLLPLQTKWYTVKCSVCGQDAFVVSTLRKKDKDHPIKNKVKCSCSKGMIEQNCTEEEAKYLTELEKEAEVPNHPVSNILRNGRISAFENMNTDDLFTVRALYIHSLLYNEILKIENDKIKNLLLLAFSSNLANCSKLVPPIKTRGDMAPGAWMTGFYIGETYLENNVLHYFDNRLEKVIKGKADYISQINKNAIEPFKSKDIKEAGNGKLAYVIDKGDAKKLKYPDNSIDYIFTDPPYGDSVPYFEQSVFWNTWLDFKADYKNEIVVSDSKERKKNIDEYASDMSQAIHEIHRVLKEEHFFSITFHSLSGDEWYSIINACLESGFEFVEATWMTQKTFSPRQLNRVKTVKGDVLITLKKSNNKSVNLLSSKEAEKEIVDLGNKLLSGKGQNTNHLYINIIQHFFAKRYSFEKINIIKILSDNFSLSEDGLWTI